MPSLQKIAIRGFKSIRELEALDLRPLNVLIGPNGGGKSNFIELLRMLSSIPRGHLQSFASTHGGPGNILFCGRNERSMSVEVKLYFGSFSYQCTLVPSEKTLIFQGEMVTIDLPYNQPIAIHHATPEMLRKSTPRVPTKSGHSESEFSKLDSKSDDTELIAVMDAMDGFRLFQFHDTLNKVQVRYSQSMYDRAVLEPNGKNLLSTLEYISVRFPDHYRAIVSTIQVACPFFGDFIFPQDSTGDTDVKWYRMEDRNTLLSFRSLSRGTVRFIALATLLLQPSELQPHVMLIDEPELGLHPLALTLLGEMLTAASDNRQLIVATQSADLISEMQPENVIVVDRRAEESVFSRLKTSELADWLPDFSLGELWKSNLFGGCF